MLIAQNSKRRLAHKGFTIIELMIATAVFAIILIVVVTGVLQFTRQYYKGVIQTNTQNTARAIADDVTRAIQFGGKGSVLQLPSSPGSQDGGYCVGPSKEYNFTLNTQISGSIKDGLVSWPGISCSSASPVLRPGSSGFTLPANARELLGDNMRLVKFTITSVGGDLYDVSIRVAYGADDLLCSPKNIAPNNPGGCNPTAPGGSPTVFGTKNDLICRDVAGNQFCAVAQLDTTVQKRVQ